MAQAIIAHARYHPGQSLGVATFSVAQRQAILKELELLRLGQTPIPSLSSIAPAREPSSSRISKTSRATSAT